MPYGLDDQGRPIFLISTMAMHTQNLKGDSRAALLVTQAAKDGDVLGAARVTLMGDVRKVVQSEHQGVKSIYLSSYENARYWVDFDDFGFYRMEVLDLYYVGGFGVMGWVAAKDYSAAQPDPLVKYAAAILQHMNADHATALILLARVQAGVEATEAEMIAVDRLGFQVRLKTTEGFKGIRIAFSREVSDPQQTRETLMEMVKEARESNETPA